MLFEYILYVIFAAFAIHIFYKWATKNNDFFTKRKIKSLKPVFLLGNTTGLLMGRNLFNEFLDQIYYAFPNEKLIGLFDYRKPVYFVRDLDLLKQITIKQFDHFEDHFKFFDITADSLFGNILLVLDGEKWRQMRSTLSPAFTGSKMRHMFDLVVECSDEMTKYLSKQNKPIRWEMKELSTFFTNDVIASCAFGLKVNSLENPTNEFYTLGKSEINVRSASAAIRLLLLRLVPSVMKFFGIQMFSAKVKRFFHSMVFDTMKEREEKGIVRPDMINILMELRRGNLRHNENENQTGDAGFATVEESNVGKMQVKRTWNDEEIVAQCFLFFFAGYETVSVLMSFITYELAANQDIQQKLYEEISEFEKNLNGKRLNYDTLGKMKYLDQVVSETLRKWPPTMVTDRICTKSCFLDFDGRDLKIEKGENVWIPIVSFHHDPKYFPEPEKFNPERFSDENKHLIQPGSYLPFGVGPRNCIGSRFALMEAKALVYSLVLNFNIQPHENSQIPLKLKKSPFGWVPEKGIDLELKPRV